MSQSIDKDTIEQHLAALVDDDAATRERFGEALADDDELRDLVHGARQAAARVAHAGDDFQAIDFEATVLAQIDAEAGAKADVKADVNNDAKADAGPAAERDAKRDAKPARASAASKDTATGAPRQASARRWWWLAAPAAAAAAALALVIGGAGTTTERTPTDGAGQLAATVVSQVGGTVAVTDGGRHLATDARTRALIALGDGSQVTLAQSSILRIHEAGRSVALDRGAAVFDVEEGKTHFLVAVPGATVEVLGTRFEVTTDDSDTSVRVLRGHVRLWSEAGAPDGQSAGQSASQTAGKSARQSIDIEPGQEGLASNGKLELVPAYGIAGRLAWAELAPEVDSRSGATLGELRARKPGEKGDDRPLVLADQKVTVRIAGTMARTEIEQTFRNDSKDELEGIYSFPLPVDAQIERLALDSREGFEEGAFVDRERASRIWAGVIQNATPKERRDQAMEIVWVPGPWRDPALLEWKKGGRFELRIFPIPKKGQRTIKLAYTQTLPRVGKTRRYVFPMAHSSDGSTAAEAIAFDVRLTGVDPATVAAHGYDLGKQESTGSIAMAMSQKAFAPSGDLIIDYAPPGPDAALDYWSYVGEAAAAPAVAAVTRTDAEARRVKRAAGKGTAPDPRVTEAQARLASDARGYVLFALRPRLPAWQERSEHDVAIVIDSSQSMVGERFARASQVATEFVREMDRRDRVAVFACDLSCLAMSEGLLRPGDSAADTVARNLAAYRPAGSSNVVHALDEVADALAGGSRRLEILYIGDGLASAGHRRPATLAAATRALAHSREITVSTLGIGGDADGPSLAAIAAAGGGLHRSYVPGESAKAAAYALLEGTYGPRLRDAAIDLPSSLSDVVPARLPSLRAGEEILVAARMNGPVTGTIALRGKVGGKDFTQSFPIDVKPVAAAGNAFVPRTWAMLRVADLEQSGRADDRPEIIALSTAYAVLSRHTSLLVLESEAMFSAFGIDRAKPTVSWTGDDEAVVSHAGEAVASDGGGTGTTRGTRRASLDVMDPFDVTPSAPLGNKGGASAPARAADPVVREGERARMPGQWMRRVRYTSAAVATTAPARTGEVEVARQALAENPDSRDRQRRLVRALSAAGALDEAESAAEAWLVRDQLDFEALTYFADALGRQGARDAALRVLSGIVDLDPDNASLHWRLIKAYRRAGMSEQACAHEVALAETSGARAEAIGAGVRCLRVLGDVAGAASILEATATADARVQAEAAASRPPADAKVSGKLLVTGTWDGDVDLDLSIITPQGTRLSWMGGRTGVVATDARSRQGETVGLTSATPGTYVIEVNRTDGARALASAPVTGRITIQAYDERRTLPFTLDGRHLTVGSVRVTRSWRLESVDDNVEGLASVQLLQVQSSGIDTDVATRELQRQAARINQCLLRDLRAGRAAPESLMVMLRVGPTGQVTSVNVTPASSCLTNVYQRIRFRDVGADVALVRARYRIRG